MLHNRRSSSRHGYVVLAFLAPAICLVALVVLYPLIIGFANSLSDGNFVSPGKFVAFGNYLKLVQTPAFSRAVGVTAVFAIASSVLAYVLGLGLALLLLQPVKARPLWRVLLVLPWAIAPVVAVASSRSTIVGASSPVNQLIIALGGHPVYLLSSAEGSLIMVILLRVWALYPFAMLSMLGALQVIDKALYEAARVDGAKARHEFRHVTLPGIRTTSIVLLVLMAIWTAVSFDTPWLLTQGGPAGATTTLPLMAYLYAFRVGDVGMGAAVSFATLAMLIIPAAVVIRKRKS